MRLFLSYSRTDIAAADQLRQALAACGVEVWIDRDELQLGDPLSPGIEDGLRQADYVVLLASQASLSSEWVAKEWNLALQLENQASSVRLLVVKLDDCALPPARRDKLCVDRKSGDTLVVAEIMRRMGPDKPGRERRQEPSSSMEAPSPEWFGAHLTSFDLGRAWPDGQRERSRQRVGSEERWTQAGLGTLRFDEPTAGEGIAR